MKGEIVMKERFNRFVDNLQEFLHCKNRTAAILLIIPLYTEIPAIFIGGYAMLEEKTALDIICSCWVALCLILTLISNHYEPRK